MIRVRTVLLIVVRLAVLHIVLLMTLHKLAAAAVILGKQHGATFVLRGFVSLVIHLLVRINVNRRAAVVKSTFLLIVTNA